MSILDTFFVLLLLQIIPILNKNKSCHNFKSYNFNHNYKKNILKDQHVIHNNASELELL